MLHFLLLVLCALISVSIVINWLHLVRTRSKQIDRIPGPSGKPFIGSLLNFMTSPEEIWNFFNKLAVNYYPIYKYWHADVPVVNLLCPEDIEIVLSTMKHSGKSKIYNFLHPWLGTGLLTSEGNKWRTRRKILTPAFHFNVLQHFLRVFVEQGELLVKKLQQECDKPYTDIVPVITQFTLNSICETAMGTKLEATNKHWLEYAMAIFRMGESLIYRVTRPWYFFDVSFLLSSEYQEQIKLLNVIHTFSKSIIENRKIAFNTAELSATSKFENDTTKKRLGMLDLLILAKNAGQPVDDEGIREEVDTFIFEGHDTTTACISFTLLLLASHRHIQEKVVEELQEVFGDSDRTPSCQDLQNLCYLDRVLKESLRLYPSVPFISRKTDEEVHTHSGYTIPADTTVQLHIYYLHRNPIYYPEPDKFDPDRFLPENMRKRHPFAYIPFSAGPRNCIGQKFAVLEIKTMLSAILRRFALEPIDTPSSVTMIIHLVLKTKDGIKIKLRERVNEIQKNKIRFRNVTDCKN